MSSTTQADAAGTSAAITYSKQNHQLAAAGARGDAVGSGNVLVPVTIRKARQGLRDGVVDDAGWHHRRHRCQEQQILQFTSPLKVSIGAYHYHPDGHSNGKKFVADWMCPPGLGDTKRNRLLLELRNQLRRSNDGRDWYPDLDDDDDDPSRVQDYFRLDLTGSSRSPLLDDGCYVLHFLVQYRDERGVVIKDPWRADNENLAMRDVLCLLENQIPWPVLRAMHRCIRRMNSDGSGSDDDSVLDKELAHRVPILLEKRLYTIRGEGRRRPVPSSPGPAHLLDLVHHYLKPTPPEQRRLPVPAAVAPGAAAASSTSAAAMPEAATAPSTATSPVADVQPTVALSAAGMPEAAEAPSTSTAAVLVPAAAELPEASASPSPSAALPTPTGEEEEEEEEEEEHRVNIGGCSMARWRRATEYRRYAFVTLKRRELTKDVAESVLDVRLERGTLWIPTLRIDELTCTLLRNLIALEDRVRMRQRPVTAYCLFMSQLACKVEDVELLQRLDILQNFLATDEDVVQAFGDLCKGVVLEVDDPDMNYLNATWHELQKRCQRERNNFCGLLLERHCSNSVHTLAFVAAALLFAFQAAQVILAARK